MIIHFLHLLLATVLFSAVALDVFFLRSAGGEAVEPRELIVRWRKRVALIEMFTFLAVFGLGFTLWLPLAKAYPPAIFHTKMALAVVFLLLAKIRMLKERKKGVQIPLTRVMGGLLLAIFCLGIVGGLTG